jgi:hypothetical protein
MKTLLLYLSILLIISLKSYGQNSCLTAVNNQQNMQIPIPPVGTVAPVGPDYGCATILTRPIWGYVPTCDSTFMSFTFYNPLTQNSIMYSFVVWGPFHNKSVACNNLTAANIYGCHNDTVVFDYYPAVTIDANPGEYYYYMLATSDTTASSFYNTTHNIFQYNVGTNISCFECNDEVSQLFQRYICNISFDSPSQNTHITWEKVQDAGIAGYVIYRSPWGGTPSDSIGFVSESSIAEYTDYNSHALQYEEWYRIHPIDSCGNSLPLTTYAYSRAGFLQTYPAGNNTVNLNWNQFGAGTYGMQYENVQYIHRGASPSSMQIIDTVPLNVTNYTDNFAPPGLQFYAIEKRRLWACNPLRVGSVNSLLSSMTNPSVSTVTGVEVVTAENEFSLSPVPVSSVLNISLKTDHLSNKISIINGLGKLVLTQLVTQSNESIDVSELAAGAYWLTVTGQAKIIKKFVISR